MSKTEIIMFAIIVPFIFSTIICLIIGKMLEKYSIVILHTVGNFLKDAELLTDEEIKEALIRSAKEIYGK